MASEMLKAAAFRRGIEVLEVNPAYTCTIGATNYARRFGVSIHAGAACAIARRSMRLSERPAVRTGLVPARNGAHVTVPVPARKRGAHVWSQWADARRQLRVSLADFYRCDGLKRPPPPLTAAQRSVCATGGWRCDPSTPIVGNTARPASLRQENCPSVTMGRFE